MRGYHARHANTYGTSHVFFDGDLTRDVVAARDLGHGGEHGHWTARIDHSGRRLRQARLEHVGDQTGGPAAAILGGLDRNTGSSHHP